MIDKYTYVIVALLPLSALMLVFQTNPYHALVIRAILGAIAALVYIVFGGSDVALTEALVGTMLAVTLYVVAVRSSLVMRLGILKSDKEEGRQTAVEVLVDDKGGGTSLKTDWETHGLTELIASLRKIINQHYLRLELVEYPDFSALEQALAEGEVHGICTQQTASGSDRVYDTKVRVRRLFEIFKTELTFPQTNLTFVNVVNQEEKH